MPLRPTPTEIFELASASPSRSAFRRDVALCLQQHIGSDIAVFHDLAPRSIDMSTVIGLDRQSMKLAASEHDGAYTSGLLHALQGSHAVVDADLFGTTRLRKMHFFNEVVRPTGITQLLYALISFRGAAPAFVSLGRSRHSRFRERDRVAVEQLIQTMTLADVALGQHKEVLANAAQLQLTPRQLDLVAYVRMGLTNELIAAALGISRNTVRNQLSALFDRCGVSNRAELVHATRAITSRIERPGGEK